MSFEEGLFFYLDNYAGLSAEIDDRLYPLLLPQGATLPAVVYKRISTPRMLELENSFLPHPRFQFDVFAGSFPRAKAVAEQVRLALDLYRGAMGEYTVQTVIIDDEMDIYEPETKRRHSIVDAIIWYEE